MKELIGKLVLESGSLNLSEATDELLFDLNFYFTNHFPENSYLPEITREELVGAILEYNTKYNEPILYNIDRRVYMDTRTHLGHLIKCKRDDSKEPSAHEERRIESVSTHETLEKMRGSVDIDAIDAILREDMERIGHKISPQLREELFGDL